MYMLLVCVCACLCLCDLHPYPLISSWFTEVLPLIFHTQLYESTNSGPSAGKWPSRSTEDAMQYRPGVRAMAKLEIAMTWCWSVLVDGSNGYCHIYIYIPTLYSKTSKQNVSYWWLLGNASCMQDSWRLNRPRSTGRAKDITVDSLDFSSIPNVRAICFWSIVSHWMDGFWVI